MTLAAKAALAVEILASATRARRALRDDNLPRAVERLREAVLARSPHEGGAGPDGGAAAAGASEPFDPGYLGYAVQRTLRLVRGRCLLQSLTLCTMLARRGVRSTVVIGVRPGDSFGAHAWVEVDGRVLLPDGTGGFARLVEV